MEYISGRNRNQRTVLPDCIEDYVEESGANQLCATGQDSQLMKSGGKICPNYNDENLFIRQVRITPNPKLISLRKAIVEASFWHCQTGAGCKILSDQRTN